MDAKLVVVVIVRDRKDFETVQNPFENVIDPVFQIVQVNEYHVELPHPMNYVSICYMYRAEEKL